MDTLRRDLSTIPANHGAVRLVDSEVPEYVIPSWLAPNNRVSTILSLLQVRVTYNEVSGPTYVVRSDGHIATTDFRVLSLLLSPSNGEKSMRAAGKDRAYSSGSCIRGAETMFLRPKNAPRAERLALRAFYSRESRGPLILQVEAGNPDLLRYPVLRPERGAELVDLGTSRIQTLTLQGTQATRACLDRIEIGSLAP